MSFLLSVKKAKPYLVASARYSVLMSMLKAWDNCKIRGEEPEEPDIVASLVLNGTRILENEWRKIFKLFKIQIAITGIYCHQTPKVNFKGMVRKSCELGDLLWCHIHSDIRRKKIRNAILYQAKKSSDQPYRIRTDELEQLQLYSTWPEFVYVSSGALNGQKRCVRPAAPRRGAQYLLIDDRLPEHPIGCCVPNNLLINHSDLGLELVHSLELLSGDPFDDRKAASNESGWSKIIWDLLECSTQKSFRRIRSGYGNEPRISGASPSEIDGCFYRTPTTYSSRGSLLDDLWDFNFSSTDNPLEGSWIDEGGNGISILLLETYEIDEGKL